MDRYGTSALLKFNLKCHLDRLFVNNGLYFNVARNQQSVDGTSLDALKRLDEYTYESLFDRWIYESDCLGVSPYTTTICSGVYINGQFVSKSGAYPHSIDYEHGRVLFTNSIPVTSGVVTSPFSYKHVIVDFPESDVVNLVFSAGKDNTDLIQYAYPSGNQRQIPLVVIDPQVQLQTPFALGGYKKVTQHVVLHLLANNDSDLDQIVDILSNQFRNVILGVDFNKTPAQFTYKGDLDTTYQSYTQLQGNNSYSWARLYIDRVTIRNRDVFYGRKGARVDLEINLIRAQ